MSPKLKIVAGSLLIGLGVGLLVSLLLPPQYAVVAGLIMSGILLMKISNS